MRRKTGFSIDATTASDLDVLAFVTGRSKSEIVEAGVSAQLDRLTPSQREAFEAARAARGSAS